MKTGCPPPRYGSRWTKGQPRRRPKQTEGSPMECYVGLDVHSKASVFVMQDGHGQVLAQGEMPTTPEGFRRWHEAQRVPAGTPVALETGTVAFAGADRPGVRAARGRCPRGAAQSAPADPDERVSTNWVRPTATCSSPLT